MPRSLSSPRALSPYGILAALVLVVVAIVLLFWNGQFGSAATFATSNLPTISLWPDGFAILLVVVAAIVAWWT